MLDVRTLELIHMNCSTVEPSQNRQVNEQTSQDKSSRNKDVKDAMTDGIRYNNEIDYFLVWSDKQAEKERSAKVTKTVHQEFADAALDIGCFKSHILIAGKRWHKTLPSIPKVCSLYATRTLKEAIERLQQQQIIVTLGIDEMLKWGSSFVLMPKLNWKVWPCLDPSRLNQVLIRPVHRGLTINDILHKLTHAHDTLY